MKHIRRLWVVLLFLGVLLLVPTAAFPFEGTEDGVDPVEEIEDIKMSPVDGPNGVYADIDEQGRIHLNLSEQNQELSGTGIVDDSITTAGGIFEIGYLGDESATIWVTDDADDVTFYQGADPDDSLEGKENNVTLGPNESVVVGLLVDTTDPRNDVEAAEQFVVHGVVEDGNETPDDTPERAPEETPTDSPDETPTDSPDETPTDSPDETPTNSPEETPTDSPEESPTGPTETAGSPTPTETDENTTSQGSVSGGDFEEGEGGIFDNAGLGDTLAGTLSSSLLLLVLALLLGAGTFYAVRKLTRENS